MPKLIDHQARATIITEAAWRVLVDQGARAVSVRNVASEAGLATASLRRAFPTQADLLAGCLTLMAQRVSARITALPTRRDPVEQAMALISETLPLDDKRRLEMEVYLTLGTVALSDPGLHVTYATIDAALAALCGQIVLALAPGATPARVRREARHLHALIDGLALHMLHGLASQAALTTLRAHLTDVAAP